MRTLTPEELKEILRDHELWLRKKNEGKRADLHNVDLRKHCLKGFDLTRADLTGANLQGVDLFEVNLSRSSLQNADLSNADLRHTNLEAANLSNAKLLDANLFHARLFGATLCEANLWGANLFGADLYAANLEEANLRNANLKTSCLFEANLHRAGLENADLYGADLRHANLYKAHLGGANLYKADFSLAVGNGKEIQSIQTESPYYINITDDQIWINKQGRHWNIWATFSDDEIGEILTKDNIVPSTHYAQEVNWWRQWKPLLAQIIEMRLRQKNPLDADDAALSPDNNLAPIL